jgi:hypothetical protein
MANHLRTELVLDALKMAVYRRRPTNVIHHSDQGCQYTSIAFGKHCEKAGIRPSMGSVGDCYDNAMCESFNATLECELLAFHRFKNHQEARAAIFDFIEGWYNPHRRHSAQPLAISRLTTSNAAWQRRPSVKSNLSTRSGQLHSSERRAGGAKSESEEVRLTICALLDGGYCHNGDRHTGNHLAIRTDSLAGGLWNG